MSEHSKRTHLRSTPNMEGMLALIADILDIVSDASMGMLEISHEGGRRKVT